MPDGMPRPGRLIRLLSYRVRGRSARIILLIAVISFLSLFDLVLTVRASQIGEFLELNPLARGMLRDPTALAVFKAAVSAVAFTIFIIFRRRQLTEIACWTCCAAYVVLTVIWTMYYAHIEEYIRIMGMQG